MALLEVRPGLLFTGPAGDEPPAVCRPSCLTLANLLFSRLSLPSLAPARLRARPGHPRAPDGPEAVGVRQDHRAVRARRARPAVRAARAQGQGRQGGGQGGRGGQGQRAGLPAVCRRRHGRGRRRHRRERRRLLGRGTGASPSCCLLAWAHSSSDLGAKPPWRGEGPASRRSRHYVGANSTRRGPGPSASPSTSQPALARPPLSSPLLFQGRMLMPFPPLVSLPRPRPRRFSTSGSRAPSARGRRSSATSSGSTTRSRRVRGQPLLRPRPRPARRSRDPKVRPPSLCSSLC